MLFMWGPLHNKLYKSRVVRFWHVVVSWFCVRPGTSSISYLLRTSGYKGKHLDVLADGAMRWLWRRIRKTMKHDPLSHVGLFVHSNFLGPSGPQVLVWSEVWQSQHFPPIRDSTFQWSWAFKLYCKVAPNRQTWYLGTLFNTGSEGVSHHTHLGTGFRFLNIFIVHSFMHKCPGPRNTHLSLQDVEERSVYQILPRLSL